MSCAALYRDLELTAARSALLFSCGLLLEPTRPASSFSPHSMSAGSGGAPPAMIPAGTRDIPFREKPMRVKTPV